MTIVQGLAQLGVGPPPPPPPLEGLDGTAGVEGKYEETTGASDMIMSITPRTSQSHFVLKVTLTVSGFSALKVDI
jgi:hypothetical protein